MYVHEKRSHKGGMKLSTDPKTKLIYFSNEIRSSNLGPNFTNIRAFEVGILT